MASGFRRSRERKTNRLRKFDYSCNGYYYVTICTKNKEKYFGDVVDGEMVLNEYGEIVKQQWLWLEKQFGYVKLDEWVIMPDHMHGIIIINNVMNVGVGYSDPIKTGRGNPAPTLRISKLGNIVAYFKYQSTKQINMTNGKFHKIWQRNYYDHIIRNEESLNIICNYIRTNPLKSELDDVID